MMKNSYGQSLLSLLVRKSSVHSYGRRDTGEESRVQLLSDNICICQVGQTGAQGQSPSRSVGDEELL